MIVPIAHEHLNARRLPVVTLAIVAVCFFVHVIVSFVSPAITRDVLAAARAVVEQRESHPTTVLGRDCAEVLPGLPRSSRAPDPEDEAQAELDRRCDALSAAIARFPERRFGHAPRDGRLTTLFTAQFLHGGWVHLLFNLWFLWLCGCNLEDRWGRAVFAPFYLGAAAVAGPADSFARAGSPVPAIGASGAIAGAMGAFVVLFAATRIRFLYAFFYGRFVWGTFGAPAYLMLPLWLAQEVLSAVVGVNDGTAHAAHVGGFVFGAFVGVALRVSGLDQRLDRAVEDAVSTTEDPAIAEAATLIDQGRPRDALAKLDGVLRARPRSIEAGLERLRATQALGDPELLADAQRRLVDQYFAVGMLEPAADVLAEMIPAGAEVRVPGRTRLALGAVLARRAQDLLAAPLFAALYEPALVDLVAVRAAVAHAGLVARRGGAEEARRLYTAARESPFSTVELDREIDDALARLPRAAPRYVELPLDAGPDRSGPHFE
jgi:membrane associated rhomboid family serine protease